MDRQTDRHIDTQTQNDFIICPMLYAIAMGQIITDDSITFQLYRGKLLLLPITLTADAVFSSQLTVTLAHVASLVAFNGQLHTLQASVEGALV